jgi:putative spermidine/putrescine transport system permease protein
VTGPTARVWWPAVPALTIVGAPVTYALGRGIGASFGIGVPGADGPTLDAYRRVLASPGFLRSFGFSLWVATMGTVVAVAIGAGIAWVWTARTARIRRVDLGFVHLNLAIPHVVWAVALGALLSQSGWFARVAAGIGLVDRPDQFPVLVQDRWGVGIILHLITKELAFVLLVVVPLADRRARGAVDAAATLGASPAQQFRFVFLPSVAPALVVAAVVVFAFGLGSFEPASILGGQEPRALAVVALDRFRDADLSQRADAFAISTLLAAITALAASLCWLGTRRYFALGGREAGP